MTKLNNKTLYCYLTQNAKMAFTLNLQTNCKEDNTKLIASSTPNTTRMDAFKYKTTIHKVYETLNDQPHQIYVALCQALRLLLPSKTLMRRLARLLSFGAVT